MDHVTQATPLSGTVSRPRAKIWHGLQGHKFDDSSFSRSRDISRGV